MINQIFTNNTSAQIMRRNYVVIVYNSSTGNIINNESSG